MRHSPFFLCLFAIQTILAHGCFQHEREALLKFKTNVSDPSGIIVSWRGEDCCTWAGIKCSNQTSHVIKLHLIGIFYYDDLYFRNTVDSSSNSLSGNISSSLLALGDLKHLDLSCNNFIGNKFPKFICSLRNLKYLDLSSTGLSGIIPSQLSNLSKLYHLDLSFNDLSGIIPPQLSNLSRLQYLRLGNTYYPPLTITNIWWLSHLKSLKYLNLFGVDLQDSRQWVHALNTLPSLEELYLLENNLTIIPPSLLVVNFSSLTTFYLADNNFNTPIPYWIGKLTRITELSLLNCSFIGPIPLLHNLNSLTSFGLVDTYINEDITELMSKLSNETLEKLKHLCLTNTSLTGNLTGWLNKMTSLESLWLDMNKLNGSIPTGIGNLTNLSALVLAKNSFTGKITELHLDGLSKLFFFALSYNSITITTNSNWVPSFQLGYLAATACKLGPKFPSWLQNQAGLWQLVLSNTSIVDNVPDWFWNLTHLSYIDLSHNNIRGTLPRSHYTCALTKLKILDLSSNILSGDLPHCFPNMLQVVNLANNKIVGTIPSSVGSLNMLTVLQLNNNSFTGEIPSSLRFCKNLIVIDLGENHFFGQIPELLGETLHNLTVLRLRSNLFSGNIPPQLAHLVSLQVLDLSHNNISGLIPQKLDMLMAMALPDQDYKSDSALSNFQSNYNGFYHLSIIVTIKDFEWEYSTNIALLKGIDLSGNNLTGEIPQSITALIGLRNLNLSYNKLNGTIPKEMGNMQSLESLDFHMNELSGLIPYSVANLNFLSALNLSYNNLSGEIPTGNQLQTLLDPYIYAGNPYLCGSQINKSCNTGDISHDFTIYGDDSNNLDKVVLYLFTVLGFVFGFWMVFGVLIFKRNWRYCFFQMVDNIFDKIYVFVMIRVARLKKDRTK